MRKINIKKIGLISPLIIIAVLLVVASFIFTKEDARKDVSKIIEENNYDEIYDITYLEIGENELGADASLYESVDEFKSGIAYTWKLKDNTSNPGYIYIYQFEEESDRDAFAKELRENSNKYNLVQDNLVCEYGDSVVFAKNPITYETDKSISNTVINELCSK